LSNDLALCVVILLTSAANYLAVLSTVFYVTNAAKSQMLGTPLCNNLIVVNGPLVYVL